MARSIVKNIFFVEIKGKESIYIYTVFELFIGRIDRVYIL